MWRGAVILKPESMSQVLELLSGECKAEYVSILMGWSPVGKDQVFKFDYRDTWRHCKLLRKGIPGSKQYFKKMVLAAVTVCWGKRSLLNIIQ